MVSHTFNAGLLSSWLRIFLAFKEKRFAKRLIKSLLEPYSTVSMEKLELSGKSLYREVLLHTQQADCSSVEPILRQAESSVDRWTAPGRDGPGFREVVHFFVLT